MHKVISDQLSRVASLCLSAVLLIACSLTANVFAQATPPATSRTPTETIREFYKALSEKRFRDALAISIYKPAIEGLSAAELEELRPDFEKLAQGAEKVQIQGEQISGDTATVFVKLTDDVTNAPPAGAPLIRVGNAWIVGDKENQEIVKRSGKDFFFKARIDTHHDEVRSMLQRISLAQLAYAAQHNGQFADLPTLIKAALLPKDLETTESTGYRFHITVARDGKSYTAGAEPARYGRTGKLSFYLDPSGIRSGDVGGKPLIVPSNKN